MTTENNTIHTRSDIRTRDFLGPKHGKRNHQLTSLSRFSNCGPHSAFPAWACSWAATISASARAISLFKTSIFLFRKAGEFKISVDPVALGFSASVPASSSAYRHVEVATCPTRNAKDGLATWKELTDGATTRAVRARIIDFGKIIVDLCTVLA